MNIIVWIIFGALAGWIASLIAGTEARQGAVANVVVGIVGAFAGGFLMQLIGKSGVTGFNLYSLLVAVLGSVVLLWVYKMVTRRA
ncbi:GlsB/YeaQ/YmgE family stress response membrane protein [Candidatus Saccharibacteria bacterium]|nr:MAG: GlsB/YeaQ/YmgE family stress response membrane protein [Candidatus Saccharibacteria bacterium]